jgi:hypothetical protein
MVLERAGLLRREIKGREHHRRINARPLGQADVWLQHYRRFWNGQPFEAMFAEGAKK